MKNPHSYALGGRRVGTMHMLKDMWERYTQVNNNVVSVGPSPRSLLNTAGSGWRSSGAGASSPSSFSNAAAGTRCSEGYVVFGHVADGLDGIGKFSLRRYFCDHQPCKICICCPGNGLFIVCYLKKNYFVLLSGSRIRHTSIPVSLY